MLALFPPPEPTPPWQPALDLALLACRFEFAVPRGGDFLFASGQLISRGNLADGTAQGPHVLRFSNWTTRRKKAR